MWTTRSSSTPSTRPDGPVLELTLEVGFPSDVLGRYYPNGQLGGLMFEGKVPGAVGQLVLLNVKVERPLREFQVRAQIAWARHKGSLNLKACYGVDFVGDHERLLQFARAELQPEVLRIESRVHTDLKVRITHGEYVRQEFLVDLSHGGAFVRSPDPLAPGEEVELKRSPRNLVEIEPQNVLEIDAIPGPRYVARKERHLVRTVAHSAKTGAPVVEPPTPAGAGFDSRREADFGSGGKSHDGVGVACLDRSVTAPGEGPPLAEVESHLTDVAGVVLAPHRFPR